MNPFEYLFSLEWHGIKLGLENISYLLEASGNPHRTGRMVHVAGTNGKGSVLAFLDAVLRAAGCRTARFTSPHLVRLNERFMVNAVPITDEELERHLAFYQAIAEKMSPPPTFFELTTAVAFRWFAEQNVDYALIETGMGGRLDSTNVIAPIVTAITTIALEHTQYLGDSLELIAAEKAGIIKPAAPLVLGKVQPGPRNVILKQAQKQNAPVIMADRDFSFEITGTALNRVFTYSSPQWNIGPVPLGLAGAYQGENAAIAVALAEQLLPNSPDAITAVMQGLESARWPCRLERVMTNPDVYIDATHNPAGMVRLASELPPCIFVLSVSSDKDARGMVQALSPVARHIITTQFTGPRALSAHALETLTRQTLAETASQTTCHHADTLAEAIPLALQLAHDHNLPVVFTGSIFAAGETRELLSGNYNAPPLSFR